MLSQIGKNKIRNIVPIFAHHNKDKAPRVNQIKDSQTSLSTHEGLYSTPAYTKQLIASKIHT